MPKEDRSKLVSLALTKAMEITNVAEASTDVRFATSVAAFAQKLRGSNRLGDFSYDQIAALAASARGEDRHGYRSEFLGLVRLSETLAR